MKVTIIIITYARNILISCIVFLFFRDIVDIDNQLSLSPVFRQRSLSGSNTVVDSSGARMRSMSNSISSASLR